MNKAELCLSIANRVGLPQTKVEAVIDAFTEIVTDRLADGEKVQLFRFGTFDLREHKSRIMYNPVTGLKQQTKSKMNVVFKPGKDLKMMTEGI